MDFHPEKTYAAFAPKAGEPVSCDGKHFGIAKRLDGCLCWVAYDDGEVLPFIWCFHDGLNHRCDWPSKSAAKRSVAA